ncbi:hypothetical protein PIB30_065620 [Stylosanthes scabra]|uniref:Uncharacterized protein n=1 Tax=Stylosanthes scabra TaxID=79078 RepID=A0ABU6VQE0_9FABA|nr:hypothetical protein [Stylosanthes scabra]
MGSKGQEDLCTSGIGGGGGASACRGGRAGAGSNGRYSDFAAGGWGCSRSSAPGDQSGEVSWCLFRPLYRLPFGLILKP